MTGPDTLVEIAQAFARRGIRWLIVGGYAVIAHGYVRMTQDLDIVVDLEQPNCIDAMDVLAELGFKPRISVAMHDFTVPEKRQIWHDEREMIVFTVWRQLQGRFEQIDIFLREPFSFAEAWTERMEHTLTDGTVIPCVDLGRLIAMKQTAGRPQDALDVSELQRVQRGRP